MSVFKSPLDSFVLTSEWACAKKFDETHTSGYWAIVHGPTEAQVELTFPVELPAGAIIARAWLSLGMPTEPPKGGIQYLTVNGISIPSGGEVDISLDVADTSFAADFRFRSWGTVEEKQGEYEGSQGINVPTLCVDYVDTASGEAETDPDSAASGHTGSMRLPRLLNADMHEKTRVPPLSLSLDLKVDPLSTAEMRLPWDAPEVAAGDFAELFSPYGSVGIFRAHRVVNTMGRSREISMRHGIATLADDIVPEGNAIQAPVGQVFASIFAMQTTLRWLLGDCETPEDLEIVLERRHQNLLTALTDLTAMLPEDYAWEFDQSATPWRAHLRYMGDEPACEFRLSRDLKSLSVSVDATDQCTRLYAFGAGEGEDRIGLKNLTGTPYLDADDIDTRGVKARAMTMEDVYDALTLRDVAQRYIDKHKDPTVSIRADAIDVSAATGLPFDRFRLGKICRVPLPAYGITVLERVVGIRWRDVISRPDQVSADLANRLRKPSDEIADLIREATGAKLIGGVVESEESAYNNDSVTQSSSLVHYIDITGYGNTLAVKVKYTPPGECRLVVDSKNEIPTDEAESGSLDILRYLDSDDNGVPIVGEHYLSYFALGTETINVHSEVTVKTIEKG